MPPIRKAVFPVAGYGTRFLPATKAMPKEMLPIIDKPLIQYAVEEAVASGLTEMIFITGRNKRAIEDHFDRNPELERMLEEKQKDEILSLVKEINQNVSFIFIRQPEQLGLGNAVMCAKSAVSNEPFAVILADDLIDSDVPVLGQLIDKAHQFNQSVVAVEYVKDEQLSSYGVINGFGDLSAGVTGIRGIVEKPKDNFPSNYGVVGRYIFTSAIFESLEAITPGVGGEYQLTDAINHMISSGITASACVFDGKRYDCGNKEGFFKATVDYGIKYHGFDINN